MLHLKVDAYSKTCLKGPLKNRQNKVLKTGSILVQVERIWPALEDYCFWKYFGDLFWVDALDRFYCSMSAIITTTSNDKVPITICIGKFFIIRNFLDSFF